MFLELSIKNLVCGCSLKHQNLNMPCCSDFIWSICCLIEIYFTLANNAFAKLARENEWSLHSDCVYGYDELGSDYGAKMSVALFKMSGVDSYSRHLIKGNLLVSDGTLRLKI
jgi:hypothetical protein